MHAQVKPACGLAYLRVEVRVANVGRTILFSPQKRGRMYLPALVCAYVCVCLSVTTITKAIVDGFVPNFMGRFLGEKGRPSSLRSVEGCGSNGQKLRKPAIVHILYF